jgi:hypothetical protein
LYNPASIGTVAASRFDHDFSQVKLHAGGGRQTRPLRRTPPTIQRFPNNEDEVFTAAGSTLEEAEPFPGAVPTLTEAEQTAEETAPEETVAPGLIVEDTAETVRPRQMRRSEFLAQLRAGVTRAAEAALAGTGRTTAECPYLEYWFGYYRRQDSLHLERAIRRYAPETTHAATARDYIPIIAERVRQSVKTWSGTGEITGIPSGVPISVPGEAPAETGEGAGTSTSSVMFKSREGGARAANDPQAIQKELGEGRPLESGVRSRMESAFSTDFSHVRTHTDITAAGFSDRLNARAFTVGKHVAFGSGEYKPGTIVGDALIAHEMAHVVQQSGEDASLAPKRGDDSTCNSLEDDADKSALGAVALLWRKNKGVSRKLTAAIMPRLKSGLKLQRCKKALCPPYRNYDTGRNVETYNCAGLAHRTYDYKSLSATKSALAAGRNIGCGSSCNPGKIKHWLWEYDLHFENHTGAILRPPQPDFHTVAGVTDRNGNDPRDVYSKNGKRPVYGPNTGPYFRPPTRAQARQNNAGEALIFDSLGNPIYKVRTNYRDSCYCLPCPSP